MLLYILKDVDYESIFKHADVMFVIDTDECESSPCLYGGTCLNGVGRYTCQCPRGLAGGQCEQGESKDFYCFLNSLAYKTVNLLYSVDVIDECDSSPCVNPATCQNQIFNFSCVCIMGTSGRLCETGMDLLTEMLCSQQCYTVCIVSVDTTNECASFPCQNGGDCTNLLGGFHCQCIDGFSGSQCEIGTSSTCMALETTFRHAYVIIYCCRY